MNLADYQRAAARTSDPSRDQRDRLSNAALGLAGETGEVVELVKKHLHHGHDLPVDRMVNELGDVLWYVAELCTAVGIQLEQVGASAAHYASALPPKGLGAAAIGLSRYSGELSAIILTVMEYRSTIEHMECFRRAVSFLTYLTHLCTYAGTTIEDVADRNVAKLQQRYPEGFNSQASRERADVPPTKHAEQFSGFEWASGIGTPQRPVVAATIHELRPGALAAFGEWLKSGSRVKPDEDGWPHISTTIRSEPTTPPHVPADASLLQTLTTAQEHIREALVSAQEAQAPEVCEGRQ